MQTVIFSGLQQVNFNNSSLCNADFYKAKFLKVGFNDSNLQQMFYRRFELGVIANSNIRLKSKGHTKEATAPAI